METVAPMPLGAGIRLASAALQVIADDAGVDVLHIKGPAVDAALLASRTETDPATGVEVLVSIPRRSVDADLLVRPSHVESFFSLLRAHGWTMAYHFRDGSAFQHASTWLRPGLAAADVHRTFPGIGLDAEAAFDVLWRDRHTAPIGGYPCVVPSVTAQRLILILHATRGGQLTSGDIGRAWGRASEPERAAVDALASELDAVVPLAAGTGRLEQHRRDRRYLLWKTLAAGRHSRPLMWVARVRSQPTWAARAATAVALVAPKPGRLRHVLGREPTTREVVTAWTRLLAAGLRDGTTRLGPGRKRR